MLAGVALSATASAQDYNGTLSAVTGFYVVTVTKVEIWCENSCFDPANCPGLVATYVYAPGFSVTAGLPDRTNKMKAIPPCQNCKRFAHVFFTCNGALQPPACLEVPAPGSGVSNAVNLNCGPAPLVAAVFTLFESPYCVAQTTSCGSVPTIDGPDAETSIGAGSGSFDVTCGPVPDPPIAGAGMLIHTPFGDHPSKPMLPFGILCIDQPFFRSSVAPPSSGGPGTCDGVYTWDFGLYLVMASGSSGILPGNTCDIQAWYRDIFNPATANFSNALRIGLLP